MKRVKIVQFIGLILFVIYLIFILLDIYKVDLFQDKKIVIFSVLLAVLSITLIYKGVLLKSSSTLWFALNLICYAILIVIFEFINKDIKNYYFLLSIIPLFVSLINLAVFGYLIYIKVIIINLSIVLPILLWQFSSFGIWWVLGIGGISVIIGVLICRLIYFKREKF